MTQEQGLKVLICLFVCFMMIYWNLDIQQNQFVVMSDYNKTGVKGAMIHEADIPSFMYWTNDSLYDNIVCKSDKRITSCKYSKLRLRRVNTSTGEIEIFMELYDGFNKKKTYGGDILLMRAMKFPSGGKAAGHVTDHMNGSYSGKVQIRWSGNTTISVKLVSAIENQCLRFRAIRKYGNSVFALKTPYCIHYRFKNHYEQEFTRCAPFNFVYGYKESCNFTDLNYGFPWYCGKPSNMELNCSSYNKFQVRLLNLLKIVPSQPKNELIQNPGHCVFTKRLKVSMSITVARSPMKKFKCSKRPKHDSWTEASPTGFSISKYWRFNNCWNTFRSTNKNLRKCLDGKMISFLGDSTLRQYFEVLANSMRIPIQSDDFNKSAYSRLNNIYMTWRKHEMPFQNRELFEQEKVRSTTSQIDQLANDEFLPGNSLIVVVHYGSHLQAFPPDVYRYRLRLLVSSLKRLLQKKPETTIFVKGAAPVIADTHWFDPRISLIFNEVLFQEFADLYNQVIYLDVFSIYVANNEQNLHPFGQTLVNQVQQLMAYIC